MKKKGLAKEIGTWLLISIVAFMVVLVIHSQVVAKRIVSNSSMDNTLLDKEQLLIDKISYKFRNPEVGEIVIFYDGEERPSFFADVYEIFYSFKNPSKENGLHRRLVKRVIAVEGDEVNVLGGKVYVNDVELIEPYAKGKTYLGENSMLEYPVIVGEDEYFLLGDNREISLDSRDIGLIQGNQLEGRVWLRVYPWNKKGTVK